MSELLETLLVVLAMVSIFILFLIRLLKRNKNRSLPPDSNQLDDITNPANSWHPLNMWNDD